MGLNQLLARLHSVFPRTDHYLVISPGKRRQIMARQSWETNVGEETGGFKTIIGKTSLRPKLTYRASDGG